MKSYIIILALFFTSFANAAFTQTITNLKPIIGMSSLVVWSGGATGDSGSSASFISFYNKSFQVTGTFGGATVNLEGSNDGTNWQILNDSGNSAIGCTAACIKQVQQNTRYIRPTVVGGAASAILVQVMATHQ